MQYRVALMSKTLPQCGMSVHIAPRAGKPRLCAQDRPAFEEYNP